MLDEIEGALTRLSELRDRCRRQSVSMLVPMGQKMAYRYQEDQIEESLTALRRFRGKLAAAIAESDGLGSAPPQ